MSNRCYQPIYFQAINYNNFKKANKFKTNALIKRAKIIFVLQPYIYIAV